MGYLHSPDLSSIPGLTPCFQVVNWKSLFKSEERILYLPTHVNLPEIGLLFDSHYNGSGPKLSKN